MCESLLCKYTNNAPRAQLGRSAPKPRLPNGTNRAPGRCSLQGDLKRSSGSTHQPHRAYAQESTQAVLAPSPPVEVGQSGAGKPLAPWALLLSWGSPEPETHYKRVILHVEAVLGVRRHSAPRPLQCPPRPAGQRSNEDPSPQRHQPSSWALQSAKGLETLFGQHTPAPPGLSSGKHASRLGTQPATGRRAKRGWAASGSLGPAALLGVSRA